MKTPFKIIFLLYLFPVMVCAQNIDTKHLSLRLQFDWQQRQAFGSAEITGSVMSENDKIILDAGKLFIQSIEINSKKLKFHYDGGDTDNNLEIILDRKYKPAENFTIKINYRTLYENRTDPNAIGGSLGKGLRFLQPTSTTPNKRRQIWSSGEPQNNKYWFPCNEDIADIHTTEIKATIEKPLMLISNGSLVDIIEHPDNNTRTFHYRSEVPFPNYLISVVIGEYIDVIQKNNHTAIHNYGYPDEKEAVKATVELIPDMMRFLEEKTGYDYPLKNYIQVVVQDYPFPGSVGQNAASILSDNYIDDHGVHKDFKYLWDGVAMQALANQWFGSLIMPASWEDIWLNNAFAQYFSGLYTAKSNGKEEYLTYYHPFEKANILSDWNTGNKHPIVSTNIGDLAAFISDSYSKFRGALILRMLQKEMGDESWWKAIRDYVKNNSGKQVSTKDFQSAVEKTSGRSYQWFFEQWIYKTGLPKFEVIKKYDTSQKQLFITVKQVQNQENKTDFHQVSFFEGKIDVEIDNTIESLYLKPQAENIFTFPAKTLPKLVNFNYEETFLCETIFEKSTDEYFYQLQHSKDVLARQKALDKLTEAANDSHATTLFKDQVIDAIFTEIQSGQYWRYRWYALGSLQKIMPLTYKEKTISFLTSLIKKEKSWIKSTAINMLGNTNAPEHKNLYIQALNDESDRVVNAAAIALGKTKSPDAFEILMDLENRHSWKNQNRISALNGLQQLGDPRAIDYVLTRLEDNRSPRWYLATPVWDYPFAAVNTLVALGKGESGYPVLINRFKRSLQDNDLNDIFQNVQLINLLKDERAKEIYLLLKEKYKDDPYVLEAVSNYEKQFIENIKK
ncbi:aminopeptidase N [Chryseobacterium defluvii]|uniref:Aminopeptidase N n=1 Tax=Chryseobacterium defluvii TaxID=160396 RepID=A0A840KH51_9FLAO|nr:M1 family aminopeptidase [Chryseobacterium defluvii]MBB4807277.1 aminopeptidase N [Chryseobacterium defluvii]